LIEARAQSSRRLLPSGRINVGSAFGVPGEVFEVLAKYRKRAKGSGSEETAEEDRTEEAEVEDVVCLSSYKPEQHQRVTQEE